MNAFEPSTCAAAALGPKMRSPSAWNRSAIPATSGASGPTTVRSTERSCASASSPSMSSAPTATFSTRGSRAVPALPGATSTRSTRSLCASFHASACSRPPPPTTSTVSGPFEDGENPESGAGFTSSATAVQGWPRRLWTGDGSQRSIAKSRCSWSVHAVSFASNGRILPITGAISTRNGRKIDKPNRARARGTLRARARSS